MIKFGDGNKPQLDDYRCVYVKGIPYELKWYEIYDILKDYGSISNIMMLEHQHWFLGEAFIEFEYD